MVTPNAGGEPRTATSLRSMADALFASPTLVDLCLLLFRDPGRRFYVNELVKESGRFPRSVQLALGKLETAGLVSSEKQANAKFYRLDIDHPFFPHLSAIFRSIPDVRSLLRQALATVDGIVVAFLRPEEPETREVPLVVVGNVERSDVERLARTLAEQTDQAIQVEVFSVDDWRRQARRERSYVRWLLEEPREYLIGDDTQLPRA
ncbi:MAG TPA: helix-turn-helix domain-containing protein [Chloroflexota bacterium]|jgi:DNA-binding transcriptional ArsR family regulator|nr:helix-turn-helix domain-containing protein [Chloroflexota bacterium]